MREKLNAPVPLWLAVSTAAVIELFLLFAMMDVKIPNPLPPQKAQAPKGLPMQQLPQ